MKLNTSYTTRYRTHGFGKLYPKPKPRQEKETKEMS